MRIKEIKIPYAGLYYHYLPWYDRENITFLDIARTLDLVFRLLQDELSIVDRNLYLDTAVEALSIYQRDLGLDIANGASVEERRKVIQGYLHYLHQQTTEQVVQELCESFDTDSTRFNLARNPAEVDMYGLIVWVLSNGKNNLNSLIKMLEKILPAHLDFDVRVTAKDTINLREKTSAITNPLYAVGQHRCGTIYRHQYTGKKVVVPVKIPNGTAIRPQRNLYTGETKSGGVKR